MAGRSGCYGQLKELELSGSCGAMGGSEESDYVTALACEASHVTRSSLFLSARSDSVLERAKKKSGDCNSDSESVEERIERSKSHWSTLADQSGCVEGEEVAEVSNVEVFKALQLHPVWGGFFDTFGYDLEGGRYPSQGELVVGEKFAEGAQAELYDAQVTWWKPEDNEEDVRDGRKYVLKIFRKGTFLKHLQSQLPQGFLKILVEEMENWASPSRKALPKLSSNILRGTLLKDGRFAFLMEKEHFDLRNLIECNMQSRSGEDCGPFSKEEAIVMMYYVALGVNWLHSHDIVHRDLKASNVLVYEFKSVSPKWTCYVADYECSVGVVGTGFFRAPEILQACKDGEASSRLEVFTRAADVYSYGMTLYEILTGKLPFENHPLSDNKSLLIDCVINQHLRPEIPEYVEDWACEVLRMCWQFDPMERPSIGEILELLSNNSIRVRVYKELLIENYGQDF